MTLRLAPLLAVAFLLASPCAGQSPSQWQQHVDYDMDVRLNTETHRVDGHQRLTYTNNSPDTLRTVYYHLYFNAFHPESMMAERNRELPDPDGRIVPRIFNLAPDEQGWHEIESLTQDGQSVSFHVNDTVMRVDLAEPIRPGESSTFEMEYRSQVPLQTRRSGRDSRGDSIDYTMTQWYPKMAAYDERGWHANLYVNREYYAPYGEFDVEITLPETYTIGSTGVLQNPGEVGHGYDQRGNATWKPSGNASDDEMLTWHFRAENVHNFAWSADPDYVHEKSVADGTTFHILYKPEVAEQWTPLKNDMPELTSFFNKEFGEYAYPQMTVAQAGDGGMEYPMYTAVSSYDGPAFEDKSSYRSVLGTTIHEYAHMWYYATLGTNEADYAWMDEGFTSYATTEGFTHMMGGSDPSHSGSALSVARLQELGLYETMSTPADWFQTNAAYGTASYPGGEMIVDMLGYVIGDAQRDQWLKRYFRERKFQHPDPFDLELFAEDVSGLMLDWYFWQFTGSSRSVDDAIDKLQHTPSGDGYEASFTLEREGEAVLPHDVKLTLADGSTQWVHVPLLSMHGHKPVPDDWIVTEPWPWVVPEKTFTVEVPARVEEATIDPNNRTPDVNRLNNSTTLPLQTRFLRAPQSSWSNYELGVRPLAGYADNFGIGGGIQARGRYFMGSHQIRAMLTLWPEVFSESNRTGAWVDAVDYELSYERQLPLLDPEPTVGVAATHHLGVFENSLSLQLGLSAILSESSEQLRLALLHQYNPTDRVYGINRAGTGFNPWNQTNVLSARASYTIERDGDRVSAFVEAGSALNRSLDANRLGLSLQETTDLGPVSGRANLNVGLGGSQLLTHKLFVLGSRPIEDQWRNDAHRQTSSIFEDPLSDAHFVGFGPSGPVAYLRSPARLGQNVISGRLTLGGSPFAGVAPLTPLRLEVFSGVGNSWFGGAFLAGFDASDLIGDAGVGASYDVSQIPHLDRWTAQSDLLQDLQLVAKFPLWASDPGLIDPDEDEFEFRWLIGIQL